jgi:hypothetical protein
LILKLTSGFLSDEAYKRGSKLIDGMLYEKQNSLIPNETTPSIMRCWEFVKFFMENIASIWLKSQTEMNQMLQRIVIPAGFTIRNNIVKPFFQ